MKLTVKKLSILGLVAIFFVFIIMCCCFTDTVQAKSPTPSCHQTAQDTESSHKGEECDCDESIAIIKKDVVLNDVLLLLAMSFMEQQPERQLLNSFVVFAYQVPQPFYDTLPLTIKYSILRV